MREQLLDGDVFLARVGEFRNVARHRVAQSDLPALDQNHHRSRSRHDFRQRGQIEDRVHRHRFNRRFECAITISSPPYDFALPTDQHDCAGQLFPCDLGFNCLINVSQLRW